jgi:hypothetical protein
MATLAAVLREDPKPISELMPAAPAEVGKLIAKLMRKDPERRLQSMADVKLSLEDLRDESESGSTATSPPAPPSAARPGRRWLLVAAPAALLMFAGAAMVWMKRPPAEPGAPPKLIQVTSFTGIEGRPALSPDGRQVVFEWDGDREGGSRSLYLKLVDAGSPVRLTTSPDDDVLPTWSPDGSYIAFIRLGLDLGIYVMPALGGKERKVLSFPRPALTETGAGLDWSPDGQSLIYSDMTAEPWVIRRVSLNGESLGQMPRPRSESWGGGLMSLSPNGTALAFIRFKSMQQLGLLVQDLDAALKPAGEARAIAAQLTPPITPQRPAWLPDGQSLVATAVGATLQWIPLDGRLPRRIDAAGSNARAPSMARAAPRLAFGRAFLDTNILRVDLTAPKPAAVRVIASSLPDMSADQASPDTRHRRAHCHDVRTQRESRVVDHERRWGKPGNDHQRPQYCRRARAAGRAAALARRQVGGVRRAPGGQCGHLSAGIARRSGEAPHPQAWLPAKQSDAEPGDDHSARFSRDGKWIYSHFSKSLTSFRATYVSHSLSILQSAASSVGDSSRAKNNATYGDSVQSRSLVGAPWCCIRASQSMISSCGGKCERY